MGKVRTIPAVRDGPRDRMAIDAGRPVEYTATLLGIRTEARLLSLRLLLELNPFVEIGFRIDHHAEKHLAVLRSAVLRALAKEETGFVRVDPRIVLVIRDEVRLAG